MNINIQSIGEVKCERTEARDDYWGGVISHIILDKSQFTAEVTQGLSDFSHIEVVYHFHKVEPEKIETIARNPRNNQSWPKVGIFAQRAKGRPNRLGVSICKLHKVEGLTLTVEGLDAIDGTPVIDIKPYMKEFGPIGETSQPVWSSELMENYYKK